MNSAVKTFNKLYTQAKILPFCMQVLTHRLQVPTQEQSTNQPAAEPRSEQERRHLDFYGVTANTSIQNEKDVKLFRKQLPFLISQSV